MNTKVIKIDKDNPNSKHQKLMQEAADVIKMGGLVAFPTETVYGLGANALDENAAGKIYEAKGRPSDNPLIAHIAHKEELNGLVAEIPETAEILMDKYWPGPLTLVFKKSDIVPYGTTGGLDTVAVRMPSEPIARRLIELSGVPIAAPSANTSGRPSPTTAEHVYRDMNGRIDVIIDGGAVGIGLESTIVDVTDTPMLLRPGAVTYEMLTETLGHVDIDPTLTGELKLTGDMKPKAPGMKYRHYAPKADMYIVMPAAAGYTQQYEKQVIYKINELAKEQKQLGKKVGIICTEESAESYNADTVKCIGTRRNETTIAHNLYNVLREFDELDTDIIYSEGFDDRRLGGAIMNRLKKAAGGNIIYITED